jgi:hypothetical protein
MINSGNSFEFRCDQIHHSAANPQFLNISQTMKSITHQFLLAFSLLLLPSLSLHAAVDSLLFLDAKCYFQKKIATTPDRMVGKVEMTRLNTKQLLQILTRDTGINYTNGSRLKVVAGAIFVADANSKTLGDVSQYFQLTVNTQAGLLSGTRNLTTGAEQTRTYQSMSFTINLPTLKGKMNGLLTEDTQISSPNRLGIQEARASGNANINGKGTINRSPAYFEGTFRLSGYEAILNR